MNVSYNSALRQSKAIRNELSTLTAKQTPTPAEIGNISASLATFTKTIDEYNALARQEIVPKKQDEAHERIRRFREDLTTFRSDVDALKKVRDDVQYQTNRTNQALDDYIARGQAVLGDLGQQREMLKSTQKRLYSVANTLGVSSDTIRMVERRAREDKWIFAAGVIVFILFCWLVLHYLR
ncbi:golgi SNAP receptor complex member 2 [Geosmithia morbida]|uniref:Protein transport protein BOS1 n=1 Tax=Geosmithia morbida TaxID=1094350 RepID=A0A9P5D775_9HYPO|nr:golgi SNAP receptor complex member 2 [Geosmithia morbida]KAF4125510.1 golgi SNAP receptor complex member 2 [Geosmithia morbida]